MSDAGAQGASPAASAAENTNRAEERRLALGRLRDLALVPAIIVIAIVGYWVNPVFLSFDNISNILQSMSEIGVPYQWAGASPNGFDCSGLVMYAYSKMGVSLPHSSYAMWNDGVSVPKDQLQAGDLVFFDGLGHVGIYIGGGASTDTRAHGPSRARMEIVDFRAPAHPAPW